MKDKQAASENHYKVTGNLEEMDLALIHQFISNSYWSKNIPLGTFEKALSNSLCFGIFSSDGIQVGFARMITDKATYAYLADVFILDEHRGQGLSKILIKEILAHPELQGLRRIVLATRDAHGLYEQFGFKALANPTIFMEVWTPNVYT